MLEKSNPWTELGIPLERARRWHPLNRGIWVAARVTLAGHLLQAKGDRVSMHSSVEVRYPFLDEDVFAKTKVKIAPPKEEGDDEMQVEHESIAEECMKFGKLLSANAKAFGLADSGDELEPLPAGIRTIHNGVPVHAIPRFGAAPVQKTALPPDFARLVAVETEDE